MSDAAQRTARTVYSDGDALGQHVAVGAYESGNFGERVELAVVISRFLGRRDGHKVEAQFIRLSDGEDGGRARVELSPPQRSACHKQSLKMKASGRTGRV